MAVKTPPSITSTGLAGNIPSHGSGEVPEELSDIILRRGQDEEILWRSKPESWRLAATAFHTNSVAIYFVLLSIYSGVTDSLASAITMLVMGCVALLILFGLAFLYAKKSHYILTNERFLILSGIAFEKRISIPLSRISAAHLKLRKGGYGTIALELSEARMLGYLILWPHARPFRFNNPQPLIRVIPEAEAVAKTLAEAVAGRAKIDQRLTKVNSVDGASVTINEQTNPGDRKPAGSIVDEEFKEATA